MQDMINRQSNQGIAMMIIGGGVLFVTLIVLQAMSLTGHEPLGAPARVGVTTLTLICTFFYLAGLLKRRASKPNSPTSLSEWVCLAAMCTMSACLLVALA